MSVKTNIHRFIISSSSSSPLPPAPCWQFTNRLHQHIHHFGFYAFEREAVCCEWGLTREWHQMKIQNHTKVIRTQTFLRLVICEFCGWQISKDDALTADSVAPELRQLCRIGWFERMTGKCVCVWNVKGSSSRWSQRVIPYNDSNIVILWLRNHLRDWTVI